MAPHVDIEPAQPDGSLWLSRKLFKESVYWPGESLADSQFNDQMKIIWTREAVTIYIAEDAKEWPTLPDKVRGMIVTLLLFFAASDAFANQLTLEGLMGHYSNMHIKGMISFHGMMEIVHAQAYAELLTLPYPGGIDQDEIYDRVISYPSVVKMLEWGHRFAQPGLPLIKRLIGLVVYEGVIFTPMFLIIYGIKSKNKLKALCTANEYIARDELKHVNNALILIMQEIDNGEVLDEEFVRECFRSALAYGEGLMAEALPEDVPEWNLCKADVIDYTKMLSNLILGAMGLGFLYKIDYKMPAYLAVKDLPQFTSFHSLRPTQYTRAKQVTNAEIDGLFSDRLRRAAMIGED